MAGIAIVCYGGGGGGCRRRCSKLRNKNRNREESPIEGVSAGVAFGCYGS